MQLLLATNKVPFTLVLGITTQQPESMVIHINDYKKQHTVYIHIEATVNGYREFNLNLPQSPTACLITILNKKNGNQPNNVDKSFEITKFKPENLEHCNNALKGNDASFVKFAQWFSEQAGILSASLSLSKPSIYRSEDAKFQIDYYNHIIDNETNQVLNTPARIAHVSGIIEVAKKDFINYTIPMRMIILLHEYSHKYKNPSINKPIGYETGADINALNIYLGLGYSPSEAIYVFLNVFKDADNEQNAKRMEIIYDFIDEYTQGKIKGSCKLKTNLANAR